MALPFGAIFYLLSLGLVAAATVGVFFGLGLYLLAHRAPPDTVTAGAVTPVAISKAQTASAARGPVPANAARPLSPPAAAAAPTPPAKRSRTTPGETPIASASTAPAIAGAPAAAAETAGRSGAGSTGVTLAPAGPTSSPVSPMAPTTHLPTLPPPGQPASESLSAAQIAVLLVRGDAAFRQGDIASARLFYQRAVEAGEGRGALGMGATYDPDFLRRSRLRGLPPDPAKARAWYLRALALGAAEAESRLVKLQASAPR